MFKRDKQLTEWIVKVMLDIQQYSLYRQASYGANSQKVLHEEEFKFSTSYP